MTFAAPWVLLLLPVSLAIFLLWVAVTRRSIRRAAAFSRRPIARAPYVTAFLATAALAVALFAAAQPRWGVDEVELERQGASILFVLDVSRGMAAADVAPDRFAAARDAVAATLGILEGDRVGLVVFGGSASLRFPVTSDYGAARDVLHVMEPGSIFVDPGTDIARALDLARIVLAPEEDRGRLVVLLTDGEHLAPGDPAAAAARLADGGIDLLVAGVGTAEGALVPIFDRQSGEVTTLRDAAGAPVITRLDEPGLLAIARAGQGTYIGADPSLLPGAVRARLASLESGRVDARSAEVPIERFQWFALGALGLLFLAMWGERISAAVARFRLARAASLALLTAVLLAGCAEEGHRVNARGLDAYARGDYHLAAEHFRDAERRATTGFRVSLNLAAALHAAGDYERAMTAAGRALESSSTTLRGEAHSFIGHSAFAMGDLPAALAAFGSALREDPNPEYRHNYEVLLRLLEPPPEEDPPGEAPEEGPGDGSEPGANGDQEPGSQPGDEPAGDPGDGPDGSDGTDGSGGGGPQTVAAVEDAIAAIDEAVGDLGIADGRVLTPAEAREVLELLAERARLAALRQSLAGSTASATDY